MENLKDKLGFKKQITFGIEIEVEDIYPLHIRRKGMNDKILKKWNYHFDDSLVKDYSIELSSPIFKDQKNSYEAIKKMCEFLKSENANPNRNSSMQIQFSANIFEDSYDNLKNFYKMWVIYEHIIYRLSYGISNKPRGNIVRYATPIAIYLKNKMDTITYDDNLINLSRIIGNNKKYAISFRYKEQDNTIKLKTIEIRTINGTIDPILIQNYIEFFYHFINYPTTSFYDEDLVNYMFNTYDKSKELLKNYDKLYIDDAIKLADMIFKSSTDKDIFLSNYIKDDGKVLKK